jgi:predicted molibdopterin-dependent oxidoreductase YjgC
MILEHFQGEVIGYEALIGRINQGEVQALYATGHGVEPWIDENLALTLKAKVQFLVVQDTMVTPLAHAADVVLAGATFAEKAGSYVNADGRLQYAEGALPPRDGSLPDLDLFAILLGRGAGPISSREILAELAATVPAFAAAEGGTVPAFGISLEGARAGSGADGIAFTDPWTKARGALV